MGSLQNFVVSSYGVTAVISPFEPGGKLEAESGACGLDAVAIKSYSS